jgi:hypothetical protein
MKMRVVSLIYVIQDSELGERERKKDIKRKKETEREGDRKKKGRDREKKIETKRKSWTHARHG